MSSIPEPQQSRLPGVHLNQVLQARLGRRLGDIEVLTRVKAIPVAAEGNPEVHSLGLTAAKAEV